MILGFDYNLYKEVKKKEADEYIQSMRNSTLIVYNKDENGNTTITTYLYDVIDERKKKLLNTIIVNKEFI